MNRARIAVAVTCVLLLGVAVLVSPSGAHVNKRSGHLWREHIKPKLSRDGRINRDNNPVDWTRLKNVPAGLADGVDDVGESSGDVDCDGCVDSGDVANGTIALVDLAFDPATQGELDGFKSALAATDNAVNDGDDLVSWFNLKDVPAGFADGIDSGGAIGPAADVVCTGCVDTADLAGDAVTSAKILNGTVAQADLTFDPATQAELDALGTGDGTINEVGDPVHWTKLQGVPGGFADGTDNVDGGTASDLVCAGCVETADIDDLAVTTAKLAGLSVTTAKLDDLAVTGAKLADNSVNQSKLTDNAVGTVEIINNTIDDADIADNSLTAGSLATGSVGTDEILNNTIDDADVADNALTALSLATDSVTADELADDSVDTAAIQDGAVTGEAAPGAGVPTGKIALETIAAGNLADNAVTAAKLADGSVDIAAIQDGAVTTAKMKANAATGTSGDTSVTNGAPQTLGNTIVILPADTHRVLLTGQFQVDCPGCIFGDAGSFSGFTWQLVRNPGAGEVLIGPQYSGAVTGADPGGVFGAVSFVDSAASTTTYGIRFTVTTVSPGTATFRNVLLNAVDLGEA